MRATGKAEITLKNDATACLLPSNPDIFVLLIAPIVVLTATRFVSTHLHSLNALLPLACKPFTIYRQLQLQLAFFWPYSTIDHKL